MRSASGTAKGSCLRLVRYSPRCAAIGAGVHRARCAGTTEGLVHKLATRRVLGAIGRREAPRAPMDHAKGETAIRGARPRLDPTILDAHRLVLTLHRARIR